MKQVFNATSLYAMPLQELLSICAWKFPKRKKERRYIHPQSPSTSKGVFIFDAGAIKRSAVAYNESVCIWAKGDEMPAMAMTGCG
jgi:hypothetical protein